MGAKSLAIAVAVLSGSTATQACDLMWPDAGIEVPIEVKQFIVAECLRYEGYSEEDVPACISGEQYGYRAVVQMLRDEDKGEEATERYRACRAGLGDHGGRFHRRRAECIGGAFEYAWRFEFTRRAELAAPPALIHHSSSADRGAL
jgi:hypothetical protein